MTDELKLRELGAKGILKFTIAADDTEDNEKVHKQFREWCKYYTKNDYTVGLRVLLEYYMSQGYFNVLWEQQEQLEERIATLERFFDEKAIDDESDTF